MKRLILPILAAMSLPTVAANNPLQTTLAEVDRSNTRVGYEKFIRLNEPQNKTKNSDWLELSHTYNLKRSNIRARFHGDARFYLNNNDMSLSLGEAFISYKGENKSTYTLGRKKLLWHPNEVFWQLDHFQNNRGFRLMDSKQEGLTGFHYSTRDGALKTEIFLSYFYIPSLNPAVRIDGGNVVSNSDWYKRPPEKTIISGQEVGIFYNLNTPEYRDVVIQKSLGLRMSADWGKRQNYGQVSAFSIYKPERRLRINAEAFYDPSLDRVVVNASPVVNHHVMFGGELRQRLGNTQTSLGVVTIDPNAKLGKDFDSLSLSIENNRSLESEFFKVEPKYNRETYAHYSTVFDYDSLKLSLNYLHYFSEHIKGSDDFYSETVRWKRAAGIGSAYQVNDWLQTTLSMRYDFERKDNLLNAQAIFTPYKQSVITIGSELIKSPQTNSYWSAYRANDTFYFNVAYIF